MEPKQINQPQPKSEKELAEIQAKASGFVSERELARMQGQQSNESSATGNNIKNTNLDKFIDESTDWKAMFIQSQVEYSKGLYTPLLETHRMHLLATIEKQQKVIKDLVEAWGNSWDCSSDPGHVRMHNAIDSIPEEML